MAACCRLTGIASVGKLTATVHSKKIVYFLLPFTDNHFGNIVIQDLGIRTSDVGKLYFEE
jgi:hypothetical protein